MVNSGSFDSDVDRNEKGEFTQPRRIAESPQSASSVHAVSGSLCENDFTTQTADSLPPASQAIEPTATKTEYKCSMSDLLLRARKIITSECDSGDGASRANNDVYYTHETSIVAEGYPTEIGKSEEALLTPKEDDVTKCNKPINKDQEIKTKVSVCCSVPLEKVQDILKACRSSTDGGEKISFQTKKQISKKDMCLYCDRTFVTTTLKQKHVDRFHSSKYNRRLSTRRQVAKHSVTSCIFCNKLNNVECNLKQLFEHLVTQHPKKYFGCLDCQIRFPNFKNLENHNVKIHGALREPERKVSDIQEDDEVDVETIDFIGNKLEKEESLSRGKVEEEEKIGDEEKIIKNKRKRLNGTKKKEEEKRKSLPRLSVTLEPIQVFPDDKVTVSNENFFVKEKSKLNWVKELRSKKVSVVSTKMGIKQCVRITRQQNKTLENVKNSKRKVKNNTKNEPSNKTSINTKYLSFQNHSYTSYDVSFRVKKITDHSIDNIKISSLTFDDVFDKAFFNRVKCNIQENLLNFVDGKLFKSVESENRISSFQKSINLQLDEPTQTCLKLSTSSTSPVSTTSLLTDPQISEDIDSQIDLKPSKKKGTTAVVNDEVHYKYFTRRKYQAVISENKQHRDLSKLDIWTQLMVKNRQQKIMTEQKTDKEILEYKKSDEYKNKIQIEELDRILDKRGPLEDLKEEAIRTVALEKLNGTTTVDGGNIESYFDVTIILNQLLNSVFTTDSSLDVTRDDIDNTTNASSEIPQVGEEIPTMLNLRRISYPPQEDSSQNHPNAEDSKPVMMEMTGEWARSRIYVCAACGTKMPSNTKLLLDHKNVFHEHVWCQHYEFVGNQGELYTHLSIPGLGKVGEIESSGSKMWRRSDARTCSKCNKQFNCLGDLHRHVLECGGDWSWMLARKKYKYRPYGSKTRKRRRGLLKFLHTFRERKEQSREKGKTIKKFDGPRQKPSDADTIERMLANLPAKRTTRKILSLKDGLQRTIKNPKLSKTNKTKSLKQRKRKIIKASQKSKDPVNNLKKSRRLLRSNSNIMFENQRNLMLPKYKKEIKEQNDSNSRIRRHSVRNISRVLSNKLVKANQPAVKSKVVDEKTILENEDSLKEHIKENDSENKHVFKKPKLKSSKKLQGENKTVLDVSDLGKRKQDKKGKATEEKVENVADDTNLNIDDVKSPSQDEKAKVKSSKGIKKSANLNNIHLDSKPLISLKKGVKKEVSEVVEAKKKKKKAKFTFTLRKPKLQTEHKNLETKSTRRKKNTKNKLKSVAKKIKKTITKIIQVDGSSQNKPSTRSKRFSKESPQLCFTNNELPPEDVSQLNEKLEENNSDLINPPLLEIVETTPECAPSANIPPVEESILVIKENLETSMQEPPETKVVPPEPNKLVSVPSTTKKRITKKLRGLNDCIAMLTNKLQDKTLSLPANKEDNVLAPIIEELPKLTNCNKFLEEEKNETPDAIEGLNNKENFNSNLKPQAETSSPLIVWGRLDNHPIDHINGKFASNDDIVYDNALIYSEIKEAKNDSLSNPNLTPPSNADISRNENQSGVLQLMEQYPFSEGFDDNGTKLDVAETPTKQKSDVEVGLFHEINQSENCKNPKRKQKIKHRKKKNFHSKLQNSRKSLRSRYGNYGNKQENCTRTEFSLNQSDTTFLPVNEETVVLSTSEEFSNSGKENIKSDRGIKLFKHRRSKHVKGISRKKKNVVSEPPVDLKGLEDNLLQDEVVENSAPIPESQVSEFVDSDDDVPLAAFVKKDLTKTQSNVDACIEACVAYQAPDEEIVVEIICLDKSKKRKTRKKISKQSSDSIVDACIEACIAYQAPEEELNLHIEEEKQICLDKSKICKSGEKIGKQSSESMVDACIEACIAYQEPEEEFNSHIEEEKEVPNEICLDKIKIRKSRVEKIGKQSSESMIDACIEACIAYQEPEEELNSHIEEEKEVDNEICLDKTKIRKSRGEKIAKQSSESMVDACIEACIAYQEPEEELDSHIEEEKEVYNEICLNKIKIRKSRGEKIGKQSLESIVDACIEACIAYQAPEEELDLHNEEENLDKCKIRKTRKKIGKQSSKINDEKKKPKRKKRIKIVTKMHVDESTKLVEDLIPIEAPILELEKNDKEDDLLFSNNEASNLDSPIINEALSSSLSNTERVILEVAENSDCLPVDKPIDNLMFEEEKSDSITIETDESGIIVEPSPVIVEEESSIEKPISLDIVLPKPKPKARLKTIFNNKRSANAKKKIKAIPLTSLTNIFCDICNKTFTRSENLLKHKLTLTHIAKLSELEALQAAEKSKQETTIIEDILEDSLIKDNVIPEDVDVPVESEYEEYPKNNEISSYTLGSSQDSLKLVDIISDVLSKPIDNDFVTPNNFSGLILQSDHETKRCKSLGERKSFESDKLILSPTHNIDLNEKFVPSNTADIIVEKQISLLENMIEDNRNFQSSDRIFNSPRNEEYSNQSSSSEFSLLSASKPEESDITFTHNTNIITNLIKPTLDEDNLIHTTQYEEISEDDSSSSHFQVEEQKSRKALNRDEELFLECCSLLKSSSDITDLCKKPPKSAQFLNNFGLKPLDEFEWLGQKQPTKKTADFEYISNNFISDDSRMNVSVSDNFYNDLSYSNSNMSNSNLNLKVLLDQNVNADQLFSQPPPIFEDISTESEGSNGKSLGSCLKTISSANVLNEQDVVYDKIKIKDQLSPTVESAQIPLEEIDSNAKRDDVKISEEEFKGDQDRIYLQDSHDDIIFPAPKIIQPSIADYAVPMAVPAKIKKNHNKKMLTKGAMKVFEGLKVSIPKDGIDMKEVLSCSPTSKRLQLEAEEENISANKKSCNISEKLPKSNKIINNKKTGNSLGLKITKKKYSSNQKVSLKIKTATTQNENKSHDIYDFEETQDVMETFTSNTNPLPNYRTFRNKLTEKSCDEKKSSGEFDDIDEIDNDDVESPSKKIDMCKSITKKKCMIMGRIFKNAVKSKPGDEIKNIPAIENEKIVETFVLNCQTESEIDKDPKLSEEDMNTLFDSLLKEEKSKYEQIIEPIKIDHKPKHKINRCKKRHRAGTSSDFSDEEFSIKKFPKRTAGKKNAKNNECVINLEQELKECIGVASRKSQRKCTSGKQNVLVEYWSSDESSFETDHAPPPVNYLENIIIPKHIERVCVPLESPIEGPEIKSSVVDDERNELCEVMKSQLIDIESDLKKKSKELINKLPRKLVNGNKLLKPIKNSDSSESEILDSPTIASCRRKRTAVDTLYYWSSSSEDELQDIIEVKPIREEYDDEERPLQHGWIVGDSPKKLVTMLAQAKGKKLDVECVKKNKKSKRTGV